MNNYSFTGLLQSTGWIEPAYVSLDTKGKIRSISSIPEKNITYSKIEGYALPGITNCHSHAFQYAMAGITELHDKTKSRDDFWGWRNAMYQLALSISPEQLEVIASMLYSEMLRNGYTHVVEFHYVHNDLSGHPYANRSELGERLVTAAKKTGIKITLVPILYQKGGFNKDASVHQRRFLCRSLEDYNKLFEASVNSCKLYSEANIGSGIHSMRAVDIKTIIEFFKDVPQDIPFHIHLSERINEIKESIHYINARPVEWILDNVELHQHSNLVHCTHLSEKETICLAQSNANVVLCPSTEGNLGDGLFPLIQFQKNSGKWNIGSDSHIGLNPFEELRLLDYEQRITSHSRNVYFSDQVGDSGTYALDKLIVNGRNASGLNQKDFFSINSSFDALVIKDNIPLIQTASAENRTSTIVYCTDATMYYGTIVNGTFIVKNGQHLDSEKYSLAFVKTLNKLRTR